jgi:hypothetical protein
MPGSRAFVDNPRYIVAIASLQIDLRIWPLGEIAAERGILRNSRTIRSQPDARHAARPELRDATLRQFHAAQ